MLFLESICIFCTYLFSCFPSLNTLMIWCIMTVLFFYNTLTILAKQSNFPLIFITLPQSIISSQFLPRYPCSSLGVDKCIIFINQSSLYLSHILFIFPAISSRSHLGSSTSIFSPIRSISCWKSN